MTPYARVKQASEDYKTILSLTRMYEEKDNSSLRDSITDELSRLLEKYEDKKTLPTINGYYKSKKNQYVQGEELKKNEEIVVESLTIADKTYVHVKVKSCIRRTLTLE